MVHSRGMVREIGTAFAVLALYLLTILTPLHQARATQLDFAALGYQTIETGWVLCTADTDRNETRSLVSKCPASGIGKQQLAEPILVAIPASASTPPLTIAYSAAPSQLITPWFNPSAPPRGPPALA